MLAILPMLGLVKIALVGELFLLEIFLLAYFGWSFLNGKLIADVWTRRLCMVLLVWMLAQVISDIVNESTFSDYARGQARIFMLLVNFLALRALLRTEAEILAWLFGLGTAAAFEGYEQLSGNLPEWWKYGLGIGIFLSLIAVILALNRHRLLRATVLSAILALFFGVISFLLNSRSLGGVLIVTSTIMLWSSWRQVSGKPDFQMSVGSMIIVSSVFVAVSYCTIWIFTSLADSGVLGEDARAKREDQRIEDVNPVLGVLIGGRAELISSFSAITDAPLIGHGSWAKDQKYISIYSEARVRFGGERIFVSSTEGYLAEGQIPTHSHIFGAWVESGLFGALAWLSIMYIIVQASVRTLKPVNVVGVLILAITVTLVWDIFFSPFAGSRRMSLAFFLTCITYVLWGLKGTLQQLRSKPQ